MSVPQFVVLHFPGDSEQKLEEENGSENENKNEEESENEMEKSNSILLRHISFEIE